MTVESFQGGAAGAPARCRVCGADVPQGAPRCPRCSAAAGPLDPCPHCRAEGGASPDAGLRYVCDVCGGPRVPRLDRSITYSGREVPLLRKADAARKSRAAWRAAAVASGMLLPFVLLIFVALLAIFGVKLGLVLTALVLAAPVGAFFATALSRAAVRGREIAPAIDAAWLAVAGDIARQSKGPLTAQGLAQRLGVEEPQAEELMALLDVNEVLSPGGMRFEIPSPPQGRVAEGAAAPGPTQIASAEEEAALAEQAASEARARAQKP
jgi:hypothetical protein